MICVYDIIKDHFNYKLIEKKPFHEYEYESEYGSNAFELKNKAFAFIIYHICIVYF